MTGHFVKRVQERIGTVDPMELHRALFWAIENDRKDLVEYVGRMNREGLRSWRFRVPDRRYFIAVVDHRAETCVTVLPEGMTTKTYKRVEVAA